jgi:hypothetical protein
MIGPFRISPSYLEKGIAQDPCARMPMSGSEDSFVKSSIGLNLGEDPFAKPGSKKKNILGDDPFADRVPSSEGKKSTELKK